MDRGGFRTAVMCGDADQQIVRSGFRVFDKDVKIAVVVENSGIEQLELRLILAATTILLHKRAIWKLRLWIFIEHLQVGMCRSRIEVIVELLHILAVIPFGIREPKKTFLQD